LKISKIVFYLVFGHFFTEVYKVLHLPHGTIIMSQLKNADSFPKGDFRPFQNAAQVNQILLRLPRKMTSKTTSHFDPRLPKVPRLPRG
jgi:hypothetical protein